MTCLQIRHRTSYRYREPVLLNPHRLMLRPRERHDLRIVGSELTITPDAVVTWSQDVAGNSVATATFRDKAASLDVNCSTVVDLSALPWPIFDIAASSISFPFRYSPEQWTDLGALTARQAADPEGRLGAWARGFVRSDPTDTLSLLKDLNAGVTAQVAYETREQEGTQTPLETLDRAIGSCRDFAVLFAEAARSLGFGARLVSGYLFDPHQALVGSRDAGTTHAWAEVYLPGAGWIAFDPTNQSVGGANLVPVAVVRDLTQAHPVQGSFAGDPAAFEAMTVEVSVQAWDGSPEPAEVVRR